MEGRKNIFLDLDNTIIYSEQYDNHNRKTQQDILVNASKFRYKFIPPFVTMERPGLQPFLDYLFENFNVGIWTASNKPYATKIYKEFIEKYGNNRCIQLMLFDEHCRKSEEVTGYIKSLSMLWDHWRLPNYNKNNTFIVDDLKEVYDAQPENCIRIKAFSLKNSDENDKELESVKKVLEKIKNN